MKQLLIMFLIFTLSSCNYESEKEKINISSTKEPVINNQNTEEELKETDIVNLIETKKIINEDIEEKIDNSLIEEVDVSSTKVLYVDFYSQFPLNISTWKKYNEPYQNFCEESSLLNAYYYFKKLKPSTEEYITDLSELKEIEDELYWEDWYVHTSTIQSFLTLLFFQNDTKYLNEFLEAQSQEEKDSIIWELIRVTAENNWVWWRIIFSPESDDIEESISNDSLLLVPLYWKWLNNNLFTGWWPVYHNLLIKGYSDNSFITNE